MFLIGWFRLNRNFSPTVRKWQISLLLCLCACVANGEDHDGDGDGVVIAGVRFPLLDLVHR